MAHAAERDPAVRRFEHDLREYAELRNAIVHDRLDGAVIAEPHEATAVRLEAIFNRLSNPPKLAELFATSVMRAGVDEPIGRPARAMLEGDFSQLPVYDAARFVALLTAETIARWVAAQFADGIGLLEEAPVRDVLNFTEDHENHVFHPRDATVFDALESFNEFTHRGRSLDAILITQSGKAHEQPLGIVTTFDIPKLLAASDPRAGRERGARG